MAPGFTAELEKLVVRGPAEGSDLSGQSRQSLGHLRPRTVSDVVEIVRQAARSRVRLHPISCGHNWGFGSALPPENKAWVVDLSALNSIEDYSDEAGTVRIGPGVTQLALYRALASWEGQWFFNVTGAGHSTSVLGNALERGIGYHGQRDNDLLSLEVVTGTGEIVHTRLSGDHLAKLGPDLTSLFVQGCFGIVVSASLRLLKKTDGGGAAIVRLKDVKREGEFFASILALKNDGCIQGVPHIGNRPRIITTMAPWLPADRLGAFTESVSAWTAALPITGCREITETCFALIRKKLEAFCEIETVLAGGTVTDHEACPSPGVQLQQLASGYPSNLAIPGVAWSALGTARPGRANAEDPHVGLIHVTPAVPSSAASIREALSLVHGSARTLGLGDLPVTVNIVDQVKSVLVISVSFPAAQASAAKTKARALEQRLDQAGLKPYRIGLGQEKWLGHASPTASALWVKLKSVFDPHGVFAASKYDALFAKNEPAGKVLRPARPRRKLLQEAA
jgi:4-cresol dehydrogenase (hydroxylating)